MTESHHRFDEAMLTGYLDRELTQEESQQVRLHVEACPECARTIQDLTRMRETTMMTEFNVPDDDQWDEAPRGAPSRWFRNLGWLLAALWVGLFVFLVIRDTILEEDDVLWIVIGVGFWVVPVLIFLSVLIDRIKTQKTDRYRKVQK